MENFVFTTQLKFSLARTNQHCRRDSANAKILMTYGGGSIKANGVFEQVSALSGHSVSLAALNLIPTWKRL